MGLLLKPFTLLSRLLFAGLGKAAGLAAITAVAAALMFVLDLALLRDKAPPER